MIIETRAYARAGLLGNPSDGYFGKTISVIVRNFGARVSLYQTPELIIEPQVQDINSFRNIYQLQETVSLTGYHGGAPLIKATIKKFCEYCIAEGIRLPNRNFTIRYGSSIPRQVGLAGSSAIVIATLRALMQFYEVEIPIEQQPTLALKVETEELGINAGLQDRVIQVYEGCVYMNFDKDFQQTHDRGDYKTLKTNELPQLYIAYKTDLGKVSGKVLNDIKTRYDKGDNKVIDTLAEIASLAESGKKALETQDYDTLDQLIDRNFDLRCEIMNISDSNHELIQAARSCGASAKFTGSGGSIIGIFHSDDELRRLIMAMKKINARVVKPYVL